MRLLLDELCPPGIAEALRARGHDVVPLHDASHRPLRGMTDAELLAAAGVEGPSRPDGRVVWLSPPSRPQPRSV